MALKPNQLFLIMKKYFILFFVLGTLVSIQTARAAFPEDFSDVIWLDPNISSWPETASLSMSVNSSLIIFDHDKSSVWPVGPNANLGNNTCCNANAWAFINYGGQWYAVTFEWFGFGQEAKQLRSFEGAHMKRPPFFGGGFPRWEPVNGEIYGFMVSGFARFNLNFVNVAERSNVAFYQWGVGPVDASALLPEPEPETPLLLAPITNLLLSDDDAPTAPPPD